MPTQPTTTASRASHLFAFAGGIAAAVAAAALLGLGPGDDTHDASSMTEPAGTVPEMPGMPQMPSMEEMMAMMAEAAEPAAEHEMFDKYAGSWTAELHFAWPGSDPMKGNGTMESEVVMGGRYLISHLDVPGFMGSDYKGMALQGYSRSKEHYQGAWVDTWSTNMTMTKGKAGEAGNLVMEGVNATPMGDQMMRIVTAWVGEDTYVDTFFDQMPDGNWMKSGTITYTRR